jgi:hypothetical protein
MTTAAAASCRGRGLGLRSYQFQPLQAGVPIAADDDVVVHGDAEWLGDLDDLVV